LRAVTAAAAVPAVSTPRRAVPAGACDTHTHVFGGPAFPAGPSPYALPNAPIETHAAMCATLGVTRAVLVQPTPYGRDPACLLDALARGKGRLRGVMIADGTIADTMLEAWHAAGVRALRFVEMRAPGGGGRYPGSIGVEALDALAPRLRALGWQAHLWASAAQCAEVLPGLARLGVPVVLDHLAMPERHDDPAFDAVLGHLQDGHVWVKATLCRVPRDGKGIEALRPLQDRLVARNPSRVLWGSDWPYVRMEPAPDAGAMLDLFLDWLGDPGLARRILVENPAALFDFDD
jgi:2-pyrone-4,6-dicarboxylate lactonase